MSDTDGTAEDLKPKDQRPNNVRAKLGQLVAYSTGSLGMGVWVTVPGLLLLYFLTDIVGVPAYLAGLTLLLPKIIDIVVHPVLGSWSDRRARRVGHRRGLMRGGLLLGFAMVAMFSVPGWWTGTAAAMWVGSWYIVGNLLFATFQVPYLSTPSDLLVDYHERTRVFLFRMLFLTVGLLGAGVAAPALVSSGRRGDYTVMAATLSLVMLVSAAVAIAGVRRMTAWCGFRTPQGGDHHSPWHDVKVAWSDRDFRMLVVSYLLTGTTTHLFLAGLPYYTTYIYDNAKLTALFMGLFLGPAVLAGPLWFWVSKRIGKQRGLLLSQVIFAGGSLALLLGTVAGLVVTAVVVAAMGIAFTGLQLFAFSMVPDAVANAETSGNAKAGAYTGVWTATEATGTAVGPYLYSGALWIGGFISSTAGQTVTQPQSAITALLVGFTVVPALLMVAAAAFQRRYSLDATAAVTD